MTAHVEAPGSPRSNGCRVARISSAQCDYPIRREAQTTNLPSSCSSSPSTSSRPPAAQVADQVGVDGALVDAARLGVAGADREVDGAADLLVEQDRAGAVLDPEVGADPELAQAARALVGVEHADQVLLAALGASRRRPCRPRSAAARRRPRARRSSPAGGSVTSPSTESSTGPVKNSPSGMLCSPSQGMKWRPGDPQRQVGALGDDPHLLAALDPLGEPVALLRGALPGAERVGVVGEAGAEVEVLEVGAGSSRRRRRGRWSGTSSRPSGARPRRRASSSSASARGSPPGASSGARASTLESSRVLVSAQIAIRQSASSARPARDRRDPLELRVGGVLEVGRLLAVEAQRDDRQARRPRAPARRSRRPAAPRPSAPRSGRCRPP